jgi:hypothetical protein
VALVLEQRPGDAGILVGQCQGGDVAVAPGDPAREPAVGVIRSLLEVSKRGARAVDEQGA